MPVPHPTKGVVLRPSEFTEDTISEERPAWAALAMVFPDSSDFIDGDAILLMEDEINDEMMSGKGPATLRWYGGQLVLVFKRGGTVVLFTRPEVK